MDRIKHFLESKFEKQVRSKIKLDPRAGSFNDFPPELHGELRAHLAQQGITRLYSHQHEAFESIRNNLHTLMVSQTASGKTLSFFLPILNEYIKSEAAFSVLLLYPTKALSRDQEGTFGPLLNVVKKENMLGTFDGDTPREERAKIQRQSDFIITNPDMLHSG
ncbi:MAG: DEAD/DEAH box helicase, partial [bacterium]|nr:DEAD/DEAH box helicase [bacterium]